MIEVSALEERLRQMRDVMLKRDRETVVEGGDKHV